MKGLSFLSFVGMLTLLAFPVRAEVPHWQVDAGKSQFGFVYEQEGQSKEGHFGHFTADIVFDPADPTTAVVRVRVDLASVSAGSKDADDSLKSDDWFSVAHFPEAEFRSTKVVQNGDAYRMEGTLTIRGKTVPLSLEFTLRVQGAEAHAAVTASLDRMAFDLGTGFWANPKFLGHQVMIKVDLTAHRLP